MSQCDCTWKQEVKGLAAWKVEFEENLSERRSCYLLLSQESHDPTKVAATQENPYLTFLHFPHLHILLISTVFPCQFFSSSYPHTGFHSNSQRFMLTAHALLSFPVTRAEQFDNLLLLQSAHNTWSNETFMVPYSKIDWDPIQSTTTLDGWEMPKGQPSYLELGMKPETDLYLISEIRLCLHGIYLLFSTTGMEKSHSQNTATQAALLIKGQHITDA